MFKLLKELAKAPEPLFSTSGSHSPYSAHSSDGGDLSYKPRSRSGTLQQPSPRTGSPARSRGHSRQASTTEELKPVEETDPEAKRVVQLLEGLGASQGVMDLVEVSPAYTRKQMLVCVRVADNADILPDPVDY
jgi:hypothetical protein